MSEHTWSYEDSMPSKVKQLGEKTKRDRGDRSRLRFYDRRDWRRFRDFMVGRQPWCCDPFDEHLVEGRMVAADDYDHIIPITKRPDLAFEPSNIQGLCKRCHARKSAQDKKGG